jgi:hypothetical protein
VSKMQDGKNVTWAERRQRGQTARASPRRTSQRHQSEDRTPARRRTARGQQSSDVGDADGIDALLSLANVAQEASYDQDSGSSLNMIQN